MDINQSIVSSSSIDPDDSVHRLAADEVSFSFNHVQTDSNHDSSSQKLMPNSSSSSGDNDNDQHRDPDASVHQSDVDDVSFGLNHVQIHTQKLMPESSETDEEDPDEEENDDDEDDDDGDFTFVCVGNNDNDSLNTELSEAKIGNVFPLFDQSLLLSSDSDDGKCRLPIDVPVDKVFIESPRRSRSPSESGEPETDGTITALSKLSESTSPEINMKSNSTGFSKLWRLRNEMNRSNSDGRDAFVFLESPDPATSSESKRSTAEVNGGKVVKKKGSKVKKSTPSAHEVYLKQKGGRVEEERRRSYLPYRPGLMGFFTNVNGGLSKNVHPF